ncbi:N2227-domain-containing protein [Macrolepiota fuliginosa MF-IS2]|uniref:N2227-domain-containing protein n=1 Tax=Macrolepiota fuliginosa MF-IS2 TaxID=1400762 RepID=A0A9P5X6M3_9AGAR|nr:N2227-domain-containing protein [Macrolepiota fuliginosa MF-IS2]
MTTTFFYNSLYNFDHLVSDALLPHIIRTYSTSETNNCEPFARGAVQTIQPRMDLHEDSEKNVVTAIFELPGVKKEDVSLDIHSGRLTVSAKNKISTEHQADGYAIRKRRYGKYSRTLQLPQGVKDEEIKASLENGLLVVTFPKTTLEQAPKRIRLNSWTFDILLAILFPLFLLLVGRKFLPPFPWSDIRQILTGFHLINTSPFSLQRALSSYSRYATLANQEVSSMERSYASIGRKHKHLGFRIGYPAKFNRLKEAVKQNAKLTTSIAALATREFGLDENSCSDVNFADLARVREALKHFVRDWSEEGMSEREKIFRPIFQVLNQVPPSERPTMRILVPGSGLGRLAWEISQLGFITRAVEFSYFMTLAMRFLFSPDSTATANEHRIQPFAHWFSHQRSNESLFRTVSFPDVLPRFTSNLELLEDDFLKVPVPPQDPKRQSGKLTSGSTAPGYDFIVTLFFIDTSVNVFSTIEKIYHLLQPGGIWINLGPLLWPGGAQAKAELSLEEVMHVVKEIGFIVQQEGGPDDVRSPRTVECEYTSDKNAMMSWVYRAEFWVAMKPL